MLQHFLQDIRKCFDNAIWPAYHRQPCTKTELEPHFQVQPSNGYHWRVRVPSLTNKARSSDSNDARGEHRSFGVPAEKDEKRANVSVDMLDAYAVERWEVAIQVCALLRFRPHAICSGA